MSLWSLVYPVATTNLVLNPSAEITGNFAALGAATVTREAENQYRGVYSYKIVTTAAADDGIDLVILATAAGTVIHYVSFRVTGGTAPAVLHVSMDAGAHTNHAAVLFTDGTVTHYGVQIPAAEANASVSLHITQEAAAIKTFWIDAIQCEPLSTWTTYVDGDEPGCVWTGTAHGSASTRPDHERSGGYVYDLATQYSAYVEEPITGMGSPTKESIMEPRAMMDGMVWQGTRAAMRMIGLTVSIAGTTLANFYSKKKAFMSAISRHLVVPMQPVTFWYSGVGKIVTIRAFVESGDEGGVMAGFYEIIPLNLFAAEDPYWEELLEQTPTTNSVTALAVEQMVAYRPSQPWNTTTGYWDALGAPELTGAGANIHCFAKDKAGNLYVGGDFLNLNGIADADFIAMRSPAGVWSALGTGARGVVWAMACDAAGNLYVGGDFTDLTDANGDYISMWNGAAFVSLGTGAQNVVYALTIGNDGAVYAGGMFTSMGGVANTARIAKWSGGVWSALGVGMDGGDVRTICSDGMGNLYAGGTFTNAGAVAAADYFAKWNGTAWASHGVFSSNVLAIAIAQDGRIYATGGFHTIDGTSCLHIGVYTGTAWLPLGSGLGAPGGNLAISKTGILYVAGAFSTAGGITITDRMAIWNGTSFVPIPIILPGAAATFALLADGDDIYLGFDTEGSATIYGLNAATGYIVNSGTAPCYPVITIACTVATATLQEVANATTHQTLRFNRAMQIGETITIDCRPGHEDVRSNFPSPNGSQVALLQPSDLGNFCLLPGNNKVTCYAPGTGATVTTRLRWRIKHEGVEGGAT
jgi:hypothetical protein